MKIIYDRAIIYFGSKKLCMQQDEIGLETILPVHIALQDMLGADSIYFCKQVHGAQGFFITDDFMQQFPAFCKEADYLYASKKLCALGVITADCLPVIIYHPRGLISAIHAGCKGSFENIVEKAICDVVAFDIDIKISECIIFFGPSGKVCCYEVQKDFMQQFVLKYAWSKAFFMMRDEKIYFDNPGFTLYILQKIGILPENIYTKWNLCTICDENYCSYRRQRQQAGRNISLVMLNA